MREGERKTGSKGVEEFFEEIGGYGGSVFGGAADVVYGLAFAGQGGSGGGYGLWGDGFVDQGALGCWQTGGDFAQAGCSYADVFDLAVAGAGYSSYGYL